MTAEIEKALLEHAAVLMEDAPGQVDVRRISHIDDVRVLRAAREVLTDSDLQELARLRLRVIEALDGVAAAVAAPEPDRKEGLLGLLLSPITAIARNLSASNRSKGQYDYMVQQAGGPARLPAPAHLVDAAEAWALSYLVDGRTDAELAKLRTPWLEAKIESA